MNERLKTELFSRSYPLLYLSVNCYKFLLFRAFFSFVFVMTSAMLRLSINNNCPIIIIIIYKFKNSSSNTIEDSKIREII